MSFYLVCGQADAAPPASDVPHLPTRRARRYPSDTSDAEWQVISRYVPAGGAGRAVSYPRRDIVDAIRYLAHNGCVWRALPVDFPPWPTVYHYFRAWTRDGTLTSLHAALREQIRVAEGRDSQPTAALIDAQSVRAAETVARTSRGFDAGKKVNGRKRHIAVDTTGPLLAILVTAAGVQDRDGGRALPWALRTGFQRISMIWADAGYQGRLVDWATKHLGITVAIVRNSSTRSASRSCTAGGW